jgi:hypothetical protein
MSCILSMSSRFALELEAQGGEPFCEVLRCHCVSHVVGPISPD